MHGAASRERSFKRKHFTFCANYARIIKVVKGNDTVPFYNRNASVAQWIEQCPPEACAAVRLRSDAYNKTREVLQIYYLIHFPGFCWSCFPRQTYRTWTDMLQQIDFLFHDVMRCNVLCDSDDKHPYTCYHDKAYHIICHCPPAQ